MSIVLDRLRERFPADVVSTHSDFGDDTALVRRERIVEILAFLHEHVKDGAAGVALTTLESLVAWGRKYSLYPFTFATACCGIEVMGAFGTHYDLSRFGAEVVRFSPRQADVLLVAGSIN